mmetsp:Transcript_14370/g.43412  ORF Transcript_14370/g.43412 Transcript_14370/m.43412 type:complete len:279 (+) Transcript_14370:1153-1989(+)
MVAAAVPRAAELPAHGCRTRVWAGCATGVGAAGAAGAATAGALDVLHRVLPVRHHGRHRGAHHCPGVAAGGLQGSRLRAVLVPRRHLAVVRRLHGRHPPTRLRIEKACTARLLLRRNTLLWLPLADKEVVVRPALELGLLQEVRRELQQHTLLCTALLTCHCILAGQALEVANIALGGGTVDRHPLAVWTLLGQRLHHRPRLGHEGLRLVIGWQGGALLSGCPLVQPREAVRQRHEVILLIARRQLGGFARGPQRLASNVQSATQHVRHRPTGQQRRA